MLKNYLNEELYNSIISNFSFNDITEIRMRINKKIIITIKNKKYYLKDKKENFIVATPAVIKHFVNKITENSVYAFNDSIINGYITLSNGVRVGLCGEVVVENGKITTIKNFNSINIRIPHIIRNCSLTAFEYLVDTSVLNTLIISSPGCGKTTFLRDLIFQLHSHNIHKNVLIVDERNEISSTKDGISYIDLGDFCDICTGCDKNHAFTNGIRSMSPDIIITDELDLEKDLSSIVNAINCGVNVIATIHAKDIEQLKRKNSFSSILENKLFSRFVVLNGDNGPGTLTKIYDENLNCIYCR